MDDRTLHADVDRFLERAVAVYATDVLLTVDAPPIIRRDHDLIRLEGEADIDDAAIRRILATLVGPDRVETFEREHELDFTFGWRGTVRVRGNAYVQRGSAAVALRLIPNEPPTIEMVGLPDSARSLIDRTQGLVLVTGPAGAGKSSTLAAMVDWINTNKRRHILTIEDPIEYVHSHKRSAVDQREIGTDCESFARGLRSALREDPDVLLVGEMRDVDSIATVLSMAETGHLVFSTLHTNDAPQAVDRIVDVFPAERRQQIRVQLAGSLLGVVSQRLVPRVDDGGLVAVFEVLVATLAVRNLITEGRTRQIRNTMITGIKEGMMTLEMSLNRLVADGVISYENAVAVALTPREIQRPSPSVAAARATS